MADLRGLKELIELEILVSPARKYPQPYNLDPIKPLAIKILQASECHKDCVCKYECGCAETSECGKCNPPKRCLRIKTCPASFNQGPRGLFVYGGSCLEEIEVSPQRVIPTK
jgi:hypothetical protein